LVIWKETRGYVQGLPCKATVYQQVAHDRELLTFVQAHLVDKRRLGTFACRSPGMQKGFWKIVAAARA
jgi:hypothetical protein